MIGLIDLLQRHRSFFGVVLDFLNLLFPLLLVALSLLGGDFDGTWLHPRLDLSLFENLEVFFDDFVARSGLAGLMVLVVPVEAKVEGNFLHYFLPENWNSRTNYWRTASRARAGRGLN